VIRAQQIVNALVGDHRSWAPDRREPSCDVHGGSEHVPQSMHDVAVGDANADGRKRVTFVAATSRENESDLGCCPRVLDNEERFVAHGLDHLTSVVDHHAGHLGLEALDPIDKLGLVQCLAPGRVAHDVDKTHG
jgi:hypothetical protein